MIRLDKYQSLARDSEANRLLIVAPAGSGKTRTMIARIARLIESGTAPSHIVGITFTRKAATELRERIRESIGQDVRAMTIHSFCYSEILNPFAQAIGYRRPVSIYDEYLSADIYADIMISLGLIDETKRYIEPHTIQGRLKKMEQSDPDNWIRISDMYKDRLKAFNAVDYDGIIQLAVKILKTSGIARELLRAQFDHVLVDEFQDTDIYQLELLELLNPHNLAVFADGDQSIYGWRSARPENVNDVARTSEVVSLRINYRSGYRIIETANRLIANNPSALREPAQAHDRAEPGEILIHHHLDPIGYTGDRVAGALQEYNPGEITILCRTNKLVDEVSACLDMMLIQHQRISGRRGFWEIPIVRAVIYTLMYVQNPSDIAAWSKAIDFPDRKLNPGDRAEIKKLATMERLTILQATCQSESVKAWGERISELVVRYGFKDIDAQTALQDVAETLEWVEYYRALTPRLKSTQIEFVLTRIYSELERLRESGMGNLDDFLEWYVSRDLQEDLNEKSDIVKVATIHAYKGLENEVIILPHWTAGKFPNVRSDIQEERRLAYVGITRAISECHIVYRENPSIFIDEITDYGMAENESNEEDYLTDESRIYQNESKLRA